MYVAVRQRSQGSWVVVEERAPTEATRSEPVVVPIGEIAELVPSFPAPLDAFELPDTRVFDIVGVDTSGNITLALCRVGPSSGVTQLCVARLLELAALLRREDPFAELEHRVRLLHGRSLVDLVRERLSDAHTVNERAFAMRFAENVRAGRFRVVLASRAISAEMDAMIDILDDPTDELMEFEPIEMASFAFGTWHVPQPRIRNDILPGADDDAETASSGYGYDASDESSWNEDGQWDNVLDALRDEEPLPFESIDEYERYAAELEGDEGEGAESYDEYEPPDVVLSISGRRGDEDAFFETLTDRTSRTVVQRARRLLELGREPARTLPAGWIVSREALSFQAGVLRERVSPPEPVVVEILRLDIEGRMSIDLPLLRILLADDAVSAFLRDLQSTNPVLRLAIGPAEERSVLHLEDVFDSDFDVRSFCVAVRKLVLGVGLVDGHGREAA